MVKILAISGSLRKASTNTGLLRAIQTFVSEDVEVVIADISQLPLFNEDLEVGGYPQTVQEFRNLVAGADAFIFASPEYNYGVTAPLKNAIDWASRSPNVWDDKPAAVVSSGGGSGGGKSQYLLRQTGVYINLHFINKPEFTVRRYEGQYFDADGNLVNEETKLRLKAVLDSLVAFTLRLKK